MADDKQIVSTKSVVMADDQKTEKAENTRKSQAAYTGNHHQDKVEVTINKKTKYYKKGQKETVHPTVAHIFEEKGIIDKGWEKDVVKYNAPKVVDGQLSTN